MNRAPRAVDREQERSRRGFGGLPRRERSLQPREEVVADAQGVGEIVSDGLTA